MPALEDELKAALASWDRFQLSRFQMSGDFIRTPGFTVEELMPLDPGVQLDSTKTTRAFMAQRIRGVLWYYLASHRDPFEMSRIGKEETGTVDSVDLLAALCEEFLDTATRFEQLQTSRHVIHRTK